MLNMIKPMLIEILKIKKHPALCISKVFIILVVIGIIATITISFFVQNKKEREYLSALQKSRETIGEAFRLMSVNGEIDKTMTTENYTKNVLSKHLQIIKTCDNAKDCDFPEEIKRPNGEVVSPIPTTMQKITSANVITIPRYVDREYSVYSQINDTTKNHNNAYFFITVDGLRVMFFYNPYCLYDSKKMPYYWTDNTANFEIQRQLSLDVACHWSVYDMNGKRGPNQVGKDIGFVGSFYNGKNTKAVSVLPSLAEEKSTLDIPGDDNHFLRASEYCNSLYDGNNMLPDVNELSLMYLNREFITSNKYNWFWSSSPLLDADYLRTVTFKGGNRCWDPPTRAKGYVRCVRKNTAT